MLKLDKTSTAWWFGDNINTDVIYPGCYLTIIEPSEMGKHAMEGIDKDFGNFVQFGDIIIAGHNFGCGSSREQAAMAIKCAGIKAVFARSFARIFYRNIINQGVPAFISNDAFNNFSTGDIAEIDLESNKLKNITQDLTCEFEPIPDFLMDIIRAGGNIKYLKQKLGKERSKSKI
jgi:3-isopropylmalate/(R)-2-methylmalate dehydratase small subunit